MHSPPAMLHLPPPPNKFTSPPSRFHAASAFHYSFSMPCPGKHQRHKKHSKRKEKDKEKPRKENKKEKQKEKEKEKGDTKMKSNQDEVVEQRKELVNMPVKVFYHAAFFFVQPAIPKQAM